jgi:glycosyltransferase involved in cell wall biosynthesis
MSTAGKTVLWWGRFDPDYSRNRVLRQAYAAFGWRVVDFHPLVSPIGDLEARLHQPPRADLVHVPCFRQRDIAAATRYARRAGVPLLIDPLISAYDKQLFERVKFSENSMRARWLRHYEQCLFQGAELVLADTPEHARFFSETLGVDPAKLHVVYVGAEEPLFAPGAPHAPNSPIEVLFYGTFIPLQGPQVIVEAARCYEGPPVRWVLLGNGPLLPACRKQARGLANVAFEGWVQYSQLPGRIRRADILLGVFGGTPKAQRVIPNKVFQALACGKPLVTCAAPAYPADLLARPQSGIAWVPTSDPVALARAVAGIAAQPQQLTILGIQAHASYEHYFSVQQVRSQFQRALEALAARRVP